MAKKYILALDQGTTSSRAIIFNKKGEIVAKAQNEFTQHYPENGWVEHDPMEILFSQISAILTVLRKEAVDPKENRRHRHYQSERDHRGVGEGDRSSHL